MVFKKKLAYIIFFITIISGQLVYSSLSLSNNKSLKIINLSQAIKQGLENNETLKRQKISLQQAELFYKDAWSTMFVPTISMQYNSQSNYTLTKLDKSSTATNSEHGYPMQNLELNLGSYTLFNFWKDWDMYEQARLDWNRNKELADETRRMVTFQIIKAFYSQKSVNDKYDLVIKSVRIAEAVVKLIKSRAKLGKTTNEEVSAYILNLQAAKNEVYSIESSQKAATWNLNQLIGDPLGTPYQIDEEVPFEALNVSEEQLLTRYANQSPTVKNYNRDKKKLELAYDIAKKNALPLPRISLSGVNISYSADNYKFEKQLYSQSIGNSNLDISASINFTIPITGPGGLFNSHQRDMSVFAIELQESQFKESTVRDNIQILQLVQQIKQFEQMITDNKESFVHASSILDNLFMQISKEKVSHLEIKDAIYEARSIGLSLTDNILQHASMKLDLAMIIGADEL